MAKRIYLVNIDDLYVGKYENDNRSIDELTDSEIKELAFEVYSSLESFIADFNYGLGTITSDSHYIRIIDD